MKKFIIDKYVISIDDESKLNDVIDFLKEVNLRAYNYKVTYENERISTRFVISKNVILSLEGLSLNDARKIVKSSKFYTLPPLPDNFLMIFHNTPVREDVIDRVSKLSFPTAVFDIYDNKVEVRIGEFKYSDDLLLEATVKVEKYGERLINVECNAGMLLPLDDIIAEILFKCIGVRNLHILKAIIEKGCYKVINDDFNDPQILVYMEGNKSVILKKDGIFIDNVKITKERLYKMFSI